MAVVNEYDPSFLKRFQLIDLVNNRMPPATIAFAFDVFLMEVTVLTCNQPAELLRSSAHEKQRDNIRKPCVDQENGIGI